MSETKPLESGVLAMEHAQNIFDQPFNKALVHQVTNAFLAGARAGTKAQKTRSQARGGGAKPWRQKGTGRARTGTNRNPIWRSGGRAFAASTRDYSQKVNRKMYRAALRCSLSELNRTGRIDLVETFDVETPKTKDLLLKLNAMGLSSVLIVVSMLSENLILASRNLPNVDALEVHQLNPVSLLCFEKLVLTKPAATELIAWLNNA